MKERAARISGVISMAMLLNLALFFVSSYLSGRLIQSDGQSTAGLLFNIMSPLIITGATVAFLYFLNRRMGYADKKEYTQPAPAPYSVLYSALSLLLIFVFGLLYSGVFPDASTDIYIGDDIPRIILSAISMTAVPAFCEEILYRRCIAKNMRVCGSLSAVILSSLIFGLTHFSVYVFPYAFICGIILCSLYFETERLSCSVAVHFLNNAFSFALSLLGAKAGRGTSTVLIVSVIASLALVSVICLIIILRNPRKERRPDTEHSEMSAFFTLPFILYLLCVSGVYILK